MKKLLSIFILSLIIINISTITVKAQEHTTICKAINVTYESNDNSYILWIEDTDGLSWGISLIDNLKFNKHILKILNRTMYNKQIEIIYDDMNTIDIYDDELIKYRILD